MDPTQANLLSSPSGLINTLIQFDHDNGDEDEGQDRRDANGVPQNYTILGLPADTTCSAHLCQTRQAGAATRESPRESLSALNDDETTTMSRQTTRLRWTFLPTKLYKCLSP